MEIRNRSAKKRNRTQKCSGCGRHAAMCDAVFLGTHFVPLCSTCKRTWGETYDRARLNRWPEDAKRDKELAAA